VRFYSISFFLYNKGFLAIPMSSTGYDVFDTTVQKTNELLKRIEETCEWQGQRHHAYMVLRAVLHTLRDRLPLEQIAHLGAQLPMLVRGIYYEGFDPSHIPKKMKREDFLEAIRSQITFSFEQSMDELVKQVLGELWVSIDYHEMEKIRKMLPQDLKDLVVMP
jgi:uncharacterized protein (DUF2267 family)